MNNPVGWFEIYVQDVERAKAFYESILGVKLERLGPPEGQGATPSGFKDMEMWAFPMQSEGSGASGALVRMPGFASGANSVIVYFIADDCAAVAAKVPGAGGKVFKDKFSIGQYGHIALVTDTEGNMIGLHSMK